MTALERLNGLGEAAAAEELRRCCGASRWVEQMVGGRPYRDAAHLMSEAERAWARTGPDDWKEAFRHHPKIGDVDRLRERFRTTAGWSQQEQQGVSAASERVLHELAEANQAYEQRFGFIFIVCATGKTAEQMLALLRARLPNPVEEELKVAAGEQAKITRLRLEKLLTAPQAR